MRTVATSCVVAMLVGACGFQIAATATSDGPGDDAPEGCAATWLDLAWRQRARITIDAAKVSGDLADLPVLIDQLVPGALASGDDLVFTAADGRTRLGHELESYDPATGRVLAWVKLPRVVATETTRLFVYFDNPAAVNVDDHAAVWSGGFGAVWHLGGNPAAAAPQMLDSSGHGLAATVRGAVVLPVQLPGKIGGSLDLDGLNDGLDVPSSTLGPAFSYEAWIRASTNTNWRCILNNTPSYDRWFGGYFDQLDFYDGVERRVDAMLPITAWSYVVATYDGAQLRIYRNGALIGGPVARSYPARTSTMQIGYTNTTVGEWFSGQLDEVRVSSVARSADYVLTAFRDQDDPRAFASLEPAERCP